jgi:hypothetical protein
VTPADLKEHVWRNLGPRKWLVGRSQVDLLTQLAVENWKTDFMQAADSDLERQIVAQATLADMKRMHQAVGGYGDREYGMIWTLLLSALASAIIQVMLKWWLERRTNRVMVLVWQQEGMR